MQRFHQARRGWIGRPSVLAASIDDGPDIGEEAAAPFGTEAVGDFAENDAGMLRPFGGVAGVLDIAELVGAADLLILGGPLLGVDRVGNPDRAPAVGLRRPPV